MISQVLGFNWLLINSRSVSGHPVDGMTHSPTQRARGILPDAMKDESVILIKACSELRFTYELRLATFMAQQSRRHLLVITTVDCTASSALQAFAREHGIVIQSHKS
jgi:hypothetical protein